MAGNVFEWTVCALGKQRANGPGVIRGGAATEAAGETETVEEYARTAHRKIPGPFFRSAFTGFRIACDAAITEMKE